MNQNIIIKNCTWDNYTSDNWINIGDDKYGILRKKLIDRVYPLLQIEDKELLAGALVQFINFLKIKFGFTTSTRGSAKSATKLWTQLIQNDMLDLRAILNTMLPYINDNEHDDKKHKLKRLVDLYLEKGADGTYVYTNSQYNRCIRHFNSKHPGNLKEDEHVDVNAGVDNATEYSKFVASKNRGEIENVEVNDLDKNNRIIIYERPFKKEYFLDHLELLMMSIEMCSNKLYINWMDVIPIRMSDYKNTGLYEDTIKKIMPHLKKTANVDGTMRFSDRSDLGAQFSSAPRAPACLINLHIDPTPGLSYQDIYNVASNHIFLEIKNHKWLIYDIIIHKEPISYLTHIESIIDLQNIWDGSMWSQLDISDRDRFVREWYLFYESTNISNNTILNHFYIFFQRYHVNAKRLSKQGKLIIDAKNYGEEEEEEAFRVTAKTIRQAKLGLQKVPAEEIYLFFLNQLSSFKKTWFYYVTKIKKVKHLVTIENTGTGVGVPLYITPKNIYNYCKSLVHFTNAKKAFLKLPSHWISLQAKFVELVLDRLANNATESSAWFNINGYIRRVYPEIVNLMNANRMMHDMIKTVLVDCIFESLIYHGLLSDFVPNRDITDDVLIQPLIGSAPDIRAYKRTQMKKQFFSGDNRTRYEKDAYYFLTGSNYGALLPITSKEYSNNNERDYFDFLSQEQIWTFTYAVDWVNQINFYHHYANNRVIYITGSTGVGKSTQVPKLLLYSQKMLDYNPVGKIICTQPRIPPTIGNAETISKEMGIPLKGYNKQYDMDVPTENYYIQYKYQGNEHTNTSTNNFLRIVTDGTLLEEIKKSPFLTKSVSNPNATDESGTRLPWVKMFQAENKYDIIIVDEAHEHNANMDIILTLARDTTYLNNSTKLVIVSATMENDEAIYRRYYRQINDNRSYPLSAYIEWGRFDRANVDRRMHISPPGATTQHVIKDHYLSEAESAAITKANFVEKGIDKTIDVINKTDKGDLLLFMTGVKDIKKAVKDINANTPSNVIALGYYSELNEAMKTFIKQIHQTLKTYTRYKDDIDLPEDEVTRRVPAGTYTRAVIIATNVAEASITIVSLKYVIDTGYAKVVIYDPLEEISKSLILPISQSSSTQRRGRVGRVSSGEVFYMYSKEKIINNKTAYKIADSDIKDTIISLMKVEPNDSFIITYSNDINNIVILKRMQNVHLMTTLTNYYPLIDSSEYESKNLLYRLLTNPVAYINIIKQQYMYVPNIDDITQYYTYYGKRNDKEYVKNEDIDYWFEEYLLENHDDYHYQERINFRSRAFTGYAEDVLEDNDLDFYIIHPDENVIRRNLYTGAISGINYNESVTPKYYYYLLKSNGIRALTLRVDEIDRIQLNFDNFRLIKYGLAIESAKLQLLVLSIPFDLTNIKIKYKNVDSEASRYVKQYYDEIIRESTGGYVTIKSNILSKIEEIKAALAIPMLNNINYLLWYSYSIPYGIEEDVIAIACLIETGPELSNWVDPNDKKIVPQFIALHRNNNGDIYFLYKLWQQIKDILMTSGMLRLAQVDTDIHIKYAAQKTLFENGKKIDATNFSIYDKMNKNGKLNSENEVYEYVSYYDKSFDDATTTASELDLHIQSISTANKLNHAKLSEFVQKYLAIIFSVNKAKWLYKYKIDNALVEDENATDAIEWAQKKLFFARVIHDEGLDSKWSNILETYIRTYSSNLIRTMSNYYLKMNNGIFISKEEWSPRVRSEKTLLDPKAQYIIYNKSETRDDMVAVIYLTPVKIEWVLQLNPLYYFNLFYNKSNIIYMLYPDKFNRFIIKNIEDIKQYFDITFMTDFLEQVGDPMFSTIIRKRMAQLKH